MNILLNTSHSVTSTMIAPSVHATEMIAMGGQTKMAKAPDIISHRCDKPMRRSKEHGYIRAGVRWKCTKECKHCICCILKDEYGNEHHIGAMYGSQRIPIANQETE